MCKTSYLRTALQLTPVGLERHLQGMAEKLRGGENGKVREAIGQSVARIVAGVDGSLTIEAKPGGLLGVDGTLPQLECQEGQAFLAPRALGIGDRRWHLTMARVGSRGESR